MKTKILSLVLAFIMLATLLTGCQIAIKSGTSETSAQGTPTTASAQSKEATAPADSSQLPEYSEITVEIFDRGTDGGKTNPTDNYYARWIKEKVLKELNIGVTFVAVSRWQETEQLNNLMASQSAPDVCITYSQDLISNYRDQGGLTDLAPYIDTELADLKAFLGPDTACPGRDLIIRDQVPETGAVYSIPARRINVARLTTFIRKDWLDKLNMPLPTTTDEYYNALKAFKEKDPGKVGKDKVLPFTMTDDIRWRAGTLLESFIDPTLSDKENWVYTVIDRKYLLPGYKEGVRFMNKMFNEGLIDPEFPLYSEDPPCDNLIKSGVAGSFIHNWDQPYRDSPGLLKELLVNVPDAEIVSIDPFKNSAGKTYKVLYDPAGVRFFVPAASKNVVGALRYINWLSRYENHSYLQIGDEGVTHELINGVPKLKSVQGEKIMNSSMNIDYTIMVNGLNLGDPEKNLAATALSYPFDSKYIITAYEDAMRDGKPDTVIPLPLSAAGPVTQTLIDKGDTMMAEAITAKPADFDKVWEAGIKDWLASGAQAVIDERSVKYDEYMK